jgi:hypothetical protein
MREIILSRPLSHQGMDRPHCISIKFHMKTHLTHQFPHKGERYARTHFHHTNMRGATLVASSKLNFMVICCQGGKTAHIWIGVCSVYANKIKSFSIVQRFSFQLLYP